MRGLSAATAGLLSIEPFYAHGLAVAPEAEPARAADFGHDVAILRPPAAQPFRSRQGGIDRPPLFSAPAEPGPGEDRPVAHAEPGAGHAAARSFRLGEFRQRNQAAVARVRHHPVPHGIGEIGHEVHRLQVQGIAVAIRLRSREAPAQGLHHASAGALAHDDPGFARFDLGRDVELRRVAHAEVDGDLRGAASKRIEIAHAGYRNPGLEGVKRRYSNG